MPLLRSRPISEGDQTPTRALCRTAPDGCRENPNILGYKTLIEKLLLQSPIFQQIGSCLVEPLHPFSEQITRFAEHLVEKPVPHAPYENDDR